MPDASRLIEQLLFASESDALDFKSAQYPFATATDDEKAELLKDILAFANSWARSDAYILVGVKEEIPPPHSVVGVCTSLPDAALQQFVNGKTNRPVTFQYMSCTVSGRTVGLIHIPSQERPTFLKKKFAKLRANVVYVRRGSSTAEAAPDEIARMGAERADLFAAIQPESLEVAWANAAGDPLGENAPLTTTQLTCPARDELPGAAPRMPMEPPASSYAFAATSMFDNDDYYRDFAEWLRRRRGTAPLRIQVTNSGRVLITGLEIRLSVPAGPDGVGLEVRREWAEKPSDRSDYLHVHGFDGFSLPDDIRLRGTGDSWEVAISIDKLQPGMTRTTQSMLFVSPRGPGELTCPGYSYGDNIPEPIDFNLTVRCNVTSQALTVDEVIDAANRERGAP